MCLIKPVKHYFHASASLAKWLAVKANSRTARVRASWAAKRFRQMHAKIIIIIIKKGQQWKAGREWYTPYQSEDPSPTIQPIDRKKRKGKRVENYSRDGAASANKEALALLLKPASPTPSKMGLARSFQRDTKKEIKVLLYCKDLQRAGA